MMIDMVYDSEYNTNPKALLFFHPKHIEIFQKITNDDLEEFNYAAVPNYSDFIKEYDIFIDSLMKSNVPVIDIYDLMNDTDRQQLSLNPNAIFTRDSNITLPWSPQVCILANMSLESRAKEPEIMRPVLESLGITQFYDCPHPLEGGDVMPISINGERTLLVGIGTRTSIESAKWLFETLHPVHIDRVVCILHNENFLHLDTLLSVISADLTVGVSSAIEDIIEISVTGTRKLQISVSDFFSQYDITKLEINPETAIKLESCNLLSVGDLVIGFNIEKLIYSKIKSNTRKEVHSLTFTQLPLANGGAHCLTRPIYC